ncbi:YbaB/EbfC family nucleoid-associated protein [Streptomyces sp. NPDC059894]|uniref:YbaB/EbfC family nucleoid-associated protein n=1 Tax=unclassified Streptomyces TaxID=2593676 RepID=UPI00364B49D1
MDEALERAGRAQEALTALSGTATSKDHLVSATADARGAVTELKFHTTRYRTMAPTELSAVLLDTIGRAQREAAAHLEEVLGPIVPEDLEVDDVMSGRADLADLLDAFGRGALPGQQS